MLLWPEAWSWRSRVVATAMARSAWLAGVFSARTKRAAMFDEQIQGYEQPPGKQIPGNANSRKRGQSAGPPSLP